MSRADRPLTVVLEADGHEPIRVTLRGVRARLVRDLATVQGISPAEAFRALVVRGLDVVRQAAPRGTVPM